jgi:hypothetical protein
MAMQPSQRKVHFRKAEHMSDTDKHPSVSPTVEGEFRIMPSDIDATRHFLSAFGQSETEWAALGVVLYCQSKGEWPSFTKDDLTQFFRAARLAGQTFPYYGFAKTAGSAPRDAYHLFMTDHDAPILELGEADVFKFYLLNPGYGSLVRKGDDGRYRVTEWFIMSCYKCSPATTRD